MDEYTSRLNPGRYNANIAQSNSYAPQYETKNLIGTYSSNDSCGSGIISVPTMRMNI